MRLAVFTSRYPAQVSTFFERDMRALIEAGIEIDIFSIAPLDAGLWRHSLELLGPDALPRDRVHHLDLRTSLRDGLSSLRGDVHAGLPRRDLRAILASAARHGIVPFAKTAYVLPKAWAWASAAADQYGPFDHVLAYWGNYAGTCAYAFHRIAMPDAPFSLWLHAGTDLYRTPVFLREKMLYADNIITCCEFNVTYMRQAFADIAAQIAPKIHVCHHGLDIAAFPFSTGERPANRVLAVGRLARHKGFEYLVRAAGQLAQRGVALELEFVGQGEEQRALAGLAERLGIGERVRFRGWLPFTEVRQAMAEATVLVHPSDGLGDGLPNVVREAMAVGTPVIASNVAGIPDALQDGCGVLVPPKDVDALAGAIADLLADPLRRRDIAQRARERAVERYDLWRNGARLAQLLTETRRGTKTPRRALRRRHELAGLELLLDAPRHAVMLDDIDWSELRRAGIRAGTIVRLADAVAGDEPLPPRFAADAAAACARSQRVFELVGHLEQTCARLGVRHAFLRTLECYPDAPSIVELLVDAPNATLDGVMLRDVHAIPRTAALHHRLAGAREYRTASGHRVLVRHGRLGRLGEHARYARILLARARPATAGGGTLSAVAPAPTDHLLLLALHRLYARPSFHMSDLPSVIKTIRGGDVEWDYLFATSLSLGVLPAVGCYLQYVDRLHRALLDAPLVSADTLARFDAVSGERGTEFPRVGTAARVYLRHVRATIESGRWHSAIRLSLLPLMAALTAGTTGPRRTA